MSESSITSKEQTTSNVVQVKRGAALWVVAPRHPGDLAGARVD